MTFCNFVFGIKLFSFSKNGYKKDTCVVRYQERSACVVSNSIPVLICSVKLSAAYYTEKGIQMSRKNFDKLLLHVTYYPLENKYGRYNRIDELSIAPPTISITGEIRCARS